jgi:hypothetical protein
MHADGIRQVRLCNFNETGREGAWRLTSAARHGVEGTDSIDGNAGTGARSDTRAVEAHRVWRASRNTLCRRKHTGVSIETSSTEMQGSQGKALPITLF